jgi:chromate transporter
MDLLWKFFVNILFIGCFTFGGGYAMISALQQSLVFNHGWLSPEEFSNGIAVGQITPGPLMIMVTFLGFKIAGFWGALLGTIGLFLPSFFVVIAISHNYQRVKESPIVKACLKGINASIVGIIAVAAFDMSKTNINSLPAILITLGAGILVLKFSDKDVSWILLAAGLIGGLVLK